MKQQSNTPAAPWYYIARGDRYCHPHPHKWVGEPEIAKMKGGWFGYNPIKREGKHGCKRWQEAAAFALEQ